MPLILVLGAALIVGARTTQAEAQTELPETLSATDLRSEKTTDSVAPITPEPSPSTDALEALSDKGHFSVAVVDLDTGENLSFGNGPFDTASIVKVNILAALLYQSQRDSGRLTASVDALARAMIERSDNQSTSTLFNLVGGKTGLDKFNGTIDLDQTTVGENGNWGLTQTTADDQITLLKTVFGQDSPLSTESQDYLRALMENVIDSQRFGVSVVDDDAALKVGYLQRSATGLWDVTSIGLAEIGGRNFLIAFLSDENSTLESGIELASEVVSAATDGFS